MSARDEAIARLMFAVCFEPDGEAEFTRDPLAFARRFDLHEDDARAMAADATAARVPIYRRLVRNQIGGAFRAMLGDVAAKIDRAAPDLLDKCITAYLATSPPATRHLRDAPHALFATMRPVMQADPRVEPWLVEAVDAELVAQDVGAAPDVDPNEPVTELALDRAIRFAPHLRLRSYAFRVHEPPVPADANAPPPQGPVHLLAYRDASFVVQWLEITVEFAEFMRHALAGATLGESMNKWTNYYLSIHGPVDAAAQEALTASLADLAERGLILGARRSADSRRCFTGGDDA